MKSHRTKSTRIVVKGRAVEDDCDQRMRLVERRMESKKEGRRKAVERALRSQEEVGVSEPEWELVSRRKYRRVEKYPENTL